MVRAIYGVGIVCAVVVIATIAGYLVLNTGQGGLPNLTGKKVLMIIAQDFNRTELETPMQILGQDAGASIFIASTTTDVVTGGGMQVTPDMTLEEVEVQNYDAVIFVGGDGAEIYFDNSLAHSIAMDAYNQGKKVCAICKAPVILANANVLNGKKATVWPDYIGTIQAKGATYSGESVTVDGNIITANGPQSAEEFAQTIARELG